MGQAGRELEPLFRHTANATIINGGEKANVIPSEVTVNLDCRMLPGYDAEDLLGELQDIAGPNIEFTGDELSAQALDFGHGPVRHPGRHHRRAGSGGGCQCPC